MRFVIQLVLLFACSNFSNPLLADAALNSPASITVPLTDTDGDFSVSWEPPNSLPFTPWKSQRIMVSGQYWSIIILFFFPIL